FLGTAKDNMQDAARKGRLRGAAKLTRQQVRQIVKRYQAGGTGFKGLAQRYSVSPDTISKIIAGTSYRGVRRDSTVTAPPCGRPRCFTDKHPTDTRPRFECGMAPLPPRPEQFGVSAETIRNAVRGRSCYGKA